jgi:hypothetical protein
MSSSATATQEAPVTYRRAGEYTNGIGSTLSEIEDKDVLLISYSVGKRRVFDQRQDATVERDFAEIVIRELAKSGSPIGMERKLHAWSPALCERLATIPSTALPVLACFHQVKTANGFAAWVLD